MGNAKLISQKGSKAKEEILERGPRFDAIECTNPGEDKLKIIQQRIANGYYDSESVFSDISEKLSNVLDDFE